MTIDSYGQELVIKDLQFEDMGQYVCMGKNSATPRVISRKFNIEVQGEPFTFY